MPNASLVNVCQCCLTLPSRFTLQSFKLDCMLFQYMKLFLSCTDPSVGCPGCDSGALCENQSSKLLSFRVMVVTYLIVNWKLSCPWFDEYCALNRPHCYGEKVGVVPPLKPQVPWCEHFEELLQRDSCCSAVPPAACHVYCKSTALVAMLSARLVGPLGRIQAQLTLWT